MVELALPKIFIGSSSEGLEVAKLIGDNISDISEVNIWNDGLFELGKSNLDNLYSFLNKFDIAILVVTPDDKVDIRGSRFTQARDNVIFELGLFMGGGGG